MWFFPVTVATATQVSRPTRDVWTPNNCQMKPQMKLLPTLSWSRCFPRHKPSATRSASVSFQRCPPPVLPMTSQGCARTQRSPRMGRESIARGQWRPRLQSIRHPQCCRLAVPSNIHCSYVFTRCGIKYRGTKSAILSWIEDGGSRPEPPALVPWAEDLACSTRVHN